MTKLSNDLIHNTIETLAKLLDEYYVIPEIALQMRVELLDKLTEGMYENMVNGKDLSEALTHQLRVISNDLHLNIYFSENPYVAVTAPSREDSELRLRLNNYGFEKVERLAGNIGYLVLNQFAPPELAGETAANAMSFVGDTSGLIIDLRNNKGGTSYMVALISSYLLDNATPVHLNDLYWRSYNITQSFWSLPYVSGKRFGGSKPICILTSNLTCSAAEEFAYSLQALNRAQIIGEKTSGGANPGGIHPINDHFQVFIPKGRAINPITKDNWEGKGVIPDVQATSEDSFVVAHKILLTKILDSYSSNPLLGQEQLITEIKNELSKH